MKKLIQLFLVSATVLISTGAFAYNGVWQKQEGGNVPTRGMQVIRPDKFITYTVDAQYLHDRLINLSSDPAQGELIELPVPDGSFRSFRIWQTPMMEQPLADRYPQIKTYTAYATDNNLVTAKIDMTPRGFHAMVFDGGATYFIDPYSDVNDGFYNCYYKKDLKRPADKHMVCDNSSAEDELAGDRLYLSESGLPDMQMKVNGDMKRTYRLALACTSEYSSAVAGMNATKADVLAAMVTSMNRVNGVYEKEVAVTMVLVANNDTLIYLPADTDPYSNGNGGSMLGQNQTTVTARIGSANYDIGHVFSTGGGGIASLGCVCDNNDKAHGVTGSSNPVGDVFDIDYVAHEMGHQFGANHTFNANTGSCSGNGSQTSAYEPGSGTTIMAYAGICDPVNDVQPHSDDYFHANSLSSINNFITSASAGGSCPVTVATGNTPPSLPSFSQVYTIPQGTPFELTAPEAIDTDHDKLTYCWEQWNRGDFGKDFDETFKRGPIYRSFNPDTSRTRVFVTMDSLLHNVTYYLGEKLPDTNRFLTFKLTVRDVLSGIGSFNFPDDTLHLNIVNTGQPFKVTSPSLPVVVTGGTPLSVTWNVAGTDAGAVSCANVDIYLSTDGGHTYPYLVKAGTPNDGSELINLPNVQANNSARIKVKGAGNVFFNIGVTNFTIIFDPSGVAEVAWANAVQVYPVPASDFISIRNDHGKDLSLILFNAMGQKVWAGDMKQELSIPASAFAKGMYYLQLTDPGAGERVIKPVIIQ